jgi:CheY-like chemotaxis protein/tetratricopeptide (TPR) repeat protein
MEDLLLMAETQRNLGDVFLSEKVYGKAIAAYNEALKIRAENLQDFAGAASLATQLGKVTADIGDFDAAVNNYQAALNFHRNLGDETGMAADFLNLSKAYTLLKDNDLALENAENALAAHERVSDKMGVAEANCQLGKVSLMRGDRSLADGYFEKTASILRGANFQPRLPEILKSLSLGFAELGNFPRAYQISADYAAARDSMFDADKAKSLLELTTRFESELNVRDKNRQLAVLEQKQEMEQNLRWMLLGLVGLALVALYLTFRNYRQKKADNEKLATLNAEVQAKNSEISHQNETLENKNTELKLINTRLVEEIAERERLQTAVDSKDFLIEETAAQMSASLDALERAVTEGVVDESKMLKGRRILVVEDNKVNQMLVANMLRKRGATVMTANDGLESLDAMAAMDFDLVLMDIQMPRMDGYRAVSEIRRLTNPKKSDVPIIAFTASTYVNEREKAQLFGMTDHIGKPFSPDELIGKVLAALKLPKAKSNGKALVA